MEKWLVKRGSKVKLLLIFEFILLCILLPGIIISFRLAPFMILFLWGAALYCWFILHHNRENFLRDVWRWEAVTIKNLKPVLGRWVLACIGMLVFIYFLDPGRMFQLIQERPEFIPVLLIAYPIFSALPQELIFCSFFFERYSFFKSQRTKIIASAIVFAYAHMLYINWVAPLLSLIAGLIFAITFSKTRSLALVTIEHALYGNALFIIGLGWYFYGGAVH